MIHNCVSLLGHGPFSHVFDQVFIPEACPGTDWKVSTIVDDAINLMSDGDHFIQHEQASVDMFRHMLENNPPVREEFEKWNKEHGKFVEERKPEHGKFVEELITGKPGEDSPEVSILLHSLSALFYCSVQHI